MAKVQKAKISVQKAFKHNVDGVMTDYGVGTHTVDQAVADHWYVQHHAEVIDTWEEDDGKGAADKSKGDKSKQHADGKGAADKSKGDKSKQHADGKGAADTQAAG